MISTMSAFSELEREMIVEWVVGGVRKAQAAGKHCGRPRPSSGATKPPGYAKRARAGPLSAASWACPPEPAGNGCGNLHRTVDGNQGNGRHVGGWRHHRGNRQLSAVPIS